MRAGEWASAQWVMDLCIIMQTYFSHTIIVSNEKKTSFDIKTDDPWVIHRGRVSLNGATMALGLRGVVRDAIMAAIMADNIMRWH